MKSAYVDLYLGGRRPWQRVRVQDLQDQIPSDAPAFFSPHLYDSPSPTDGESFFAHGWLDFDSEGDLSQAKAHAQAAYQFLIDEVGLQPDEIRVAFSGSKGFHLYFSGHAVGAEKSPHLHLAYRAFAEHLRETKKLSTLDLSVYSTRRVMRAPGTPHEKGGWCVPVSDLSTFDPQTPHKPAPPDPSWRFFESTERNEMAAASFAPFLSVGERSGNSELAPVKVHPQDTPPICAKYFLGKGLVEAGTRNRVQLAMLSLFVDMGWDDKKISGVMEDWLRSIPTALSKTAHGSEGYRQMLTNLRYVRSSGFRFSCAAIKSLGAPCDSPHCPVVPAAETQESPSKGPAAMHLVDSVQADHIGKRVVLEASVAATDDAPKAFPQQVQVRCKPDLDAKNSPCHRCRFKGNGPIKADVRGDPRATLWLVRSSEKARDHEAAVRKALRIPSRCPGHARDTVGGMGNLLQVFLSPRVLPGSSTDEQHRENRAWVWASSVSDQRSYRFEGATAIDPQSNAVTFVADRHKPLLESWESFAMTPARFESLQAFQAPSSSALEKIEEIYREYEHTIHGIRGRLIHQMMLGLVWFSARLMPWEGREERATLDVLAFGDTAQGKSQILSDELGFLNAWRQENACFVNGETASLAGLLASTVQMDRTWIARGGALVRAHGGLIVIDEFHGLREHVAKALSSARSSGIVTSEKVQRFRALAQCRKILAANCIDHRGDTVEMGSVPYPATHIPMIMRAVEDVRRLDYAVAFAKGHVPLDTMYQHKAIPVNEARYAPDLGKVLVNWAWSRSPKHIHLSNDTREACFTQARRLTSIYSDTIPLLDAGEAPKKIARLAIAIAIQTFSTKDGENVIIDPGHVEAAAQLLDTLYSWPEMDFRTYSEGELRYERNQERDIVAYARSLQAVIGSYDPNQLVMIHSYVVRNSGGFSRRELVEQAGAEEVVATNWLANGQRFNTMLRVNDRVSKLSSRGVKMNQKPLDWALKHDRPMWMYGAVE